MISELSTAIVARYDSLSGATFRSLNSGGLWRDKAPQGTNPPYTTFSFPTSSVESTMTNVDHDIRNVTFACWNTDDNASAVVAMGEALRNLYDNIILTLVTKNVVYANRIAENLLEDTQKGWVYYIQYEYRVG